MIPIPIRDSVPRLRTPVVTIALIAANVAAWLCELAHGVTLSVLDYGAIPSWLLSMQRDGWIQLPEIGRVFLHQELPAPWTVLSSMFLHGGWLHLIGNLWFLWIFGDNVEDAMGRVRFLLFYLLCGLAAAATQIAVTPASAAPMVGASGAIAGVLGAYFLLYPRATVRSLWFLFIFATFIDIPAWILLGVWFVSQLLLPSGSGIAWAAHVGGFAAGVLLALLLARRRLSANSRSPRSGPLPA